MRSITKLVSACLCALPASLYSPTSFANDIEISGSASFEQRYFTEPTRIANATQSQASFAIAPVLETSIGESGVFTFEGFARFDQRDDERTHVDVRQALYSLYLDNWEVRAGIGKVFWGQTESIHLVDIINQTDLVESIDGEEKLGQPMVDVRYLLDTGFVSVYVLPYFRERTFPGPDGRLRGPLRIDVDNPLYESDDEEENIDFALRWQQTWGDAEIGLSYFDGTDRLPDFRLFADAENGLRWRPFYPQLQQVGLDVLYVYEGWLLKLEAISGERFNSDYSALVAGFEYTLVDFMESGYDLGVLSEYQFDERENNPFIFGQNDIMLGFRVGFNDFASSELLLGFVQDLDETSTRQGFIEASTRLNSHWRLELNAYFFTSEFIFNPTHALGQDDHISLNIEYFF